MHREDMETVAPLWYHFTKEVRNDPNVSAFPDPQLQFSFTVLYPAALLCCAPLIRVDGVVSALAAALIQDCLPAGLEFDWGWLCAPPWREELDQRDVWVSSLRHHGTDLCWARQCSSGCNA